MASKWMGLDEAGRSFKRPVSGPTTWRRITKGILVAGRRIKLRGEYSGRRLVTCQEWIDEFEGAVTEAKLAQYDDDLEDDTPDFDDDAVSSELRELERAGLA